MDAPPLFFQLSHQHLTDSSTYPPLHQQTKSVLEAPDRPSFTHSIEHFRFPSHAGLTHDHDSFPYDPYDPTAPTLLNSYEQKNIQTQDLEAINTVLSPIEEEFPATTTGYQPFLSIESSTQPLHELISDHDQSFHHLIPLPTSQRPVPFILPFHHESHQHSLSTFPYPAPATIPPSAYPDFRRPSLAYTSPESTSFPPDLLQLPSPISLAGHPEDVWKPPSMDILNRRSSDSSSFAGSTLDLGRDSISTAGSLNNRYDGIAGDHLSSNNHIVSFERRESIHSNSSSLGAHGPHVNGYGYGTIVHTGWDYKISNSHVASNLFRMGMEEKKPRFRPTKQQLEILVDVYNRNTNPDLPTRIALARRLGPEVKPKTLQVWFQNRRSKAKAKEKERMFLLEEETSRRSSVDVVSGRRRVGLPDIDSLRGLIHDDNLSLQIIPISIFKIGSWTRFLTPSLNSAPDLGLTVRLYPGPPEMSIYLKYDSETFKISIYLTVQTIGRIEAAANSIVDDEAILIRFVLTAGSCRYFSWSDIEGQGTDGRMNGIAGGAGGWSEIGDFSGGMIDVGGPVEITGERSSLLPTFMAIQNKLFQDPLPTPAQIKSGE